MKQRQGWVSNSSSSSFMILGQVTSLAEIDLNSGKQYKAFGGWLCEGKDIFDLTPELLQELPNVDRKFYFMEVEQEIYEPNFDVVTLNGTYHVWCGEVDQNRTRSVQDLYENYERKQV